MMYVELVNKTPHTVLLPPIRVHLELHHSSSGIQKKHTNTTAAYTLLTTTLATQVLLVVCTCVFFRMVRHTAVCLTSI